MPKLRHRWPSATTASAAEALSPAERRAIYEHAATAAYQATQQIRHHAATDPHTAADAAWAAADTLRAAAHATGNKQLHLAAESYDRAARLPYGRIPRRTPTGTNLRTAAQLLSAVTITGSGTDAILAAQIRLILRLTRLAETIADLRTAQRHAAQDSAARAAAQHLHAAPYTHAPPAPARTKASTRTSPARTDFPIPLREALAKASKADGRHPPTSRTARTPVQPRPRGPTR